MSTPRYPALFQVNTRVRLSELAATLGRRATLDDIPDAELDRLSADGFDLVWLLGVWQTGEAARRVSRSKPEWLAEYRRVLPDFREDDVCGSCFAVQDYRVHEDFGGDEALARLRERLKRRGLRLILDFVPNHMAPDHPWATEHPDFFVAGTEEQRAAHPQNYCRVGKGPGARILAYGRDPYFDGWKRVRIPVHLGRGPVEAKDPGTSAFYDRLLECLKDPAFRDGDWQLLESRPAWYGSDSWEAFVAFAWTGPGGRRRLVAVNYAAHRGQCYLAMPWRDLGGQTWRLQDLAGPSVYDRAGGDLTEQGLYLDMPAWGYHALAVSPVG